MMSISLHFFYLIYFPQFAWNKFNELAICLSCNETNALIRSAHTTWWKKISKQKTLIRTQTHNIHVQKSRRTILNILKTMTRIEQPLNNVELGMWMDSCIYILISVCVKQPLCTLCCTSTIHIFQTIIKSNETIQRG